MNKINKYKKNAWYLALLNLPKGLKVILLISLLIVLSYHVQQFCEQKGNYLFTLELKYYILTKVSSDFISRLSYAVITSSIFYYITQQFPKEKKRIRMADSLANTFPFIQMPFTDFEFDLFEQDMDNISAQDYYRQCDNILLDSPVRPHLASCISWEAFTIQIMEKTIKKIDETSQLNDLLDTDTFIVLQKIKSNCLTIVTILGLRNRAMDENSKLSYLSPTLFSIRTDLILLGRCASKFIALYTARPSFKSLI